MLRNLHIENYALIRSLNINFDNGFTVITGETGAGKSILLGALSLILGNRADSSVLYEKSRKCFIEGEFDISNLDLLSFFNDNDLDYQEITTLRREVNESGKSRAFINDTPVNLQVLKDLAVKLVDIHSQHQNLLLNNGEFRLNVLDEYAQIQPELKEYKKSLSRFQLLELQWKKLVEEQIKAEQEKDFLEYLAAEFEKAGLVAREQDEIEKRISFLLNAETIKSKLFASSQILSEQDNNILQQLKEVKNNCAEIAAFNAAVNEIANRLDNLLPELKDIASDVANIENDVNINPEELEQLRQRLDFIYFLEQKHHLNSVEELLQKKSEIDGKLTLYNDNQDSIAKLKEMKDKGFKLAFDEASSLSARRHAVKESLEKDIVATLRLLGMKDARFIVEIESNAGLGASGLDKVRFLFSANKGVMPEEIEKVASGGELSRLMLAIKSIISESSLLPTVIFDEIDTGISGEVAAKVANLMNDISARRQLLAITHLPQIAAKGKLHYFVYKEVENGKTYTNIRQLLFDERVEEIAKLMSGERVGDSARNAAAELLNVK
jgi:DNA repair protein RecN (Recombination protein N)